MTKKIRIPDLTPRDYQLPFLRAMDAGTKRAVLVWHRRAGKEISCWNYMIREACTGRVGTYCYFFPSSSLGKRILWDGANKDGRRFLDYIPKELIEGFPNNVEMKIRLTNGSIIQIIGTERIINVGVNPIGCVFSEFSLQDPKTWNFVRPILRENEGWAIFNFTPRGKNAAYDLYLMAKNNPDWFCQKLAISDTGVLAEEDMEIERREGMSECLIQQEYFCSFDQGVEGSYYARYLAEADLSGRIGDVPYDPYCLVDTYWDLGVADSTAILFVQDTGQQVHIIDSYTADGEGLDHYARVIEQKAKDGLWKYGTHHAPHDIRVRELGHGAKTRLQMAADLGIRFDIVPNLSIQEGIEMARSLWHKIWIDREKNLYLLKCLENYHKRYNERLNVYSDRPEHDWSSHFCFIADTLVSTDDGLKKIQDIRAGDFVITPNGKKKVLDSFHKKTNRLVKIITNNSELVCTPGHEVFTKNGLEKADAIRYNTLLYSIGDDIWSGLSYRGENLGFRESFLLAKGIPQSSLMDMFSGGMDIITEEHLQQKTPIALCSAQCGQNIMVLSKKSPMFITLMETQKIITLKILSALKRLNTFLVTWQQKKEKIPLGKTFARLWKRPKSGTLQERELSGIDSMRRTLISAKERFRKFARSVIRTILGVTITKDFAPTPVSQNQDTNPEKTTLQESVLFASLNLGVICTLKNQRVVKSVQLRHQEEPVTVYDLEVEGDHCYFANGILVSNCDAWRYMAVMHSKSRGLRMSEDEANEMERRYASKY